MEIMSTGSASVGVSNDAPLNDTIANNSPAWPAPDMARRFFLPSLPLPARSPAPPRSVIPLAVPANIDALPQAPPGVRKGLERRHQFVNLDLGVLQKNLALQIDRNNQRLAVLVETLGLGLRQIDRHAHRPERRRDHEH